MPNPSESEQQATHGLLQHYDNNEGRQEGELTLLSPKKVVVPELWKIRGQLQSRNAEAAATAKNNTTRTSQGSEQDLDAPFAHEESEESGLEFADSGSESNEEDDFEEDIDLSSEKPQWVKSQKIARSSDASEGSDEDDSNSDNNMKIIKPRRCQALSTSATIPSQSPTPSSNGNNLVDASDIDEPAKPKKMPAKRKDQSNASKAPSKKPRTMTKREEKQVRRREEERPQWKKTTTTTVTTMSDSVKLIKDVANQHIGPCSTENLTAWESDYHLET
ncbi:uncharacterized protein PHACADRAFT_202935 [Phanerochaete carnosa HHB-10118-sp]|uniref:Uncharacterized protein n=1 Tax=Phanerochaete carnosa (strain HHB-10118-sp) TaxID=650164 RepID=K5VBA7_PHACS|nr:uncharacterized protein PHACADRAFT_202935 [Phanerochaete carnosa HHB-10118-sp]EKM48343.1 hypothetical protein PHACADRAFT_202935 [Phanerochaete carnosa HHB-10118-sp]